MVIFYGYGQKWNKWGLRLSISTKGPRDAYCARYWTTLWVARFWAKEWAGAKPGDQPVPGLFLELRDIAGAGARRGCWSGREQGWKSQGARGVGISVKFKPEGYPVAREWHTMWENRKWGRHGNRQVCRPEGSYCDWAPTQARNDDGQTGGAGVVQGRREKYSHVHLRIPESLANSRPQPQTHLLATLPFSLNASAKEANHGGSGKYLSNSFQWLQ